MRRLFRVLVVLALIYLIGVAGLLASRRSLIYAFSDMPARIADLPRAASQLLPADALGPELEVWTAPPQRGLPVIVYFMGNAGNLALNAPRLREFTLQGYGVAALAYRGGGGRTGEPSEAALLADARRVYAALDGLMAEVIPPDRRVIYGASLGTGIATALAAEVPEMAVILETPFTRLCDVAELRYPFVPACRIMWDERYDSIDRITAIGAPLLVLHGTADQIIPHALGQALFDAAAQPKAMRSYEGGKHNDLRLFGAGLDIMRFLEGL